MITVPNARPGLHEFVCSIPIVKGFDVSWAGSGSILGEFCLGSDRGELQFVDSNGVRQAMLKDAMPSREAVNGAAFIAHWLSVSTRSEVMLLTLPDTAGKEIEQALIPVGAHDVIAGIHGAFFAPLGRLGLLHYRPLEGGNQSVTVSSPVNGEQLYVYRVISVEDNTGQEVVACAARVGGVAAMQYQGEDEQNRVSTRTFAGLDVVDICALNAGNNRAAAVAIGRDATIILFQDVLNDVEPRTIRYPSIRGVAYRILSVHGHLFVLTSKGLYVIAELVDLALRGVNGNYRTPVLAIDMEAIDASLVNDKWLMVVLPDGVLRFDLSLLDRLPKVNGVGSRFADLQPILSSPVWQSKIMLQSAHSVPVGKAG
jgi:hypothetical protein